MATRPLRPRSRDDFKIAILCATPLEAEMVDAVFDKYWAKEGINLGKAPGDPNAYTLGTIGRHNVVLAHMPGTGGHPAASVSAAIRSSFGSIEIAFVTGICGASPTHPDTDEEIILGDCILSTTVVQYDYGQQHTGYFLRKTSVEDVLGRANSTIRSLVSQLQVPRNLDDLSERLCHHLEILLQNGTRTARKAIYPGASSDRLFETSSLHQHRKPEQTCEACSKDKSSCTKDCVLLQCSGIVERARLGIDGVQSGLNKPQIHFGRYGSANTVMKSSMWRDQLAKEDKISAFDMEGAGVWDNFPTLIIKSACHYADSHRNSEWKAYAASAAAAGLKAVLEWWTPTGTTKLQRTSINIPNLAVNHFVERSEITQKMDTWLLDDTTQHKMVLVGMGGAGKSQLALACTRTAANHGFTAILWYNACSLLFIQQSIKTIVSELEGPDLVSHDEQENLTIISEALQQRRGSWLAVFDNFDDLAAFQQVAITSYIPKADNGKILFTSRDITAERLGLAIHVSGMTDPESLELLLKKSVPEPMEQTVGLRIAHELGNLALALDQAQAYIHVRNLPLVDFLPHYQRRKKMILEETPKYWEYRRKIGEREGDVLLSAFTTWELSFDLISGSTEAKEFKKHFLTLCSVFDSSSVEKRYFENYCSKSDASWTGIFRSAGAWDELLFDDVAAECKRLSLVQLDDGRSTQVCMSLHPLIRTWLRLRESSLRFQQIVQEFTHLLFVYFKANDHHAFGYISRQRLLANIASSFQEDVRLQGPPEQWSEDLCKAVDCFSAMYEMDADLKRAQELRTNIVTAVKCRFGPDAPQTSIQTVRLAIIYMYQKEYDRASELLQSLLPDNEEEIGPQNPQTLVALECLGDVYKARGEHNDAMEIYGRVIMLRRKANAVPTDSYSTYIKVLHITVDDCETCKDFLKNHVDNSKSKRIGANHPHRWEVMDRLARVYENDEQFHDSLSLRQEMLPDILQEYGADDHLVLYQVSSMLRLYEKEDDHAAAAKFLEHIIDCTTKANGTTVGKAIEWMEKLAITYLRLERPDDAKALLEQALENNRASLGNEHLDTLDTMESLAVVYCCNDQGQEDIVENLLKQVLSGRKEELGPVHGKTLRVMMHLANVYGDRCDWNQAAELLEFVLDTNIHDSEDFDELQAIMMLSIVYGSTERHGDAKDLLIKALDMHKDRFGTNSKPTLKCMQDLANLYYKTDDDTNAERLCNELLTLTAGKPEKDHLQMKARQQLAMIYLDREDYEAAEKTLKDVISRREQEYGTHDIHALESMHYLAEVMASAGRFKECDEILGQLLATETTIFGSEHPTTCYTRKSMELVTEERRRSRDVDGHVCSNCSKARNADSDELGTTDTEEESDQQDSDEQMDEEESDEQDTDEEMHEEMITSVSEETNGRDSKRRRVE